MIEYRQLERGAIIMKTINDLINELIVEGYKKEELKQLNPIELCNLVSFELGYFINEIF